MLNEMLRILIVAVVGAIPSLGLILWIESGAQRLAGGSLARWRRLLIPLPMILLLLGSISDKLLWLAVQMMSPRLLDRPGMSIDLIGYADHSMALFLGLGLLGAAVLPFVLGGSLRQGVRLLVVAWGGHVLWMFFPFGLWFLSVAGTP